MGIKDERRWFGMTVKLGWRSRFRSQSREVTARALGVDKMLLKEAKQWEQNLGEFHHLGAGERRGLRAGTSFRSGGGVITSFIATIFTILQIKNRDVNKLAQGCPSI